MTHTDELHRPAFLADLLIKGLNSYDDRPCFHLGDTTATYREVREQTSRFVQVLASKGVGAGSPTAILSANRPEVLYNMSANMVAGTRNTPLHPLGSLEDHAYVVNDSGAETLVFDAEYFADHVEQLVEKCPKLKNLLAIGADCTFADNYGELAAGYEPAPLVRPDVEPTDIASLAYTGGTTGRPKGVMGTYASALEMTKIAMAELDWPDEVRFLMATPLSHAAGAFFAPVLMRGGCLYCAAGFSDEEFFGLIEEHDITATMLVPVMIYVLLDSPMAETADLSSLETIFYGASPMSPTRLAEGIRKWGNKFCQFYGQSEVPMFISVMRKRDHDPDDLDRLGSAGKPVPWVNMALLDDDNRPVAEGEPGEVCVRSPLVMAGYLGLPEQTSEATAGGWLHTGDVGRIDAGGFLHIVDRKKDMIVSGGFNVFPGEVENVIGSHDAVAQVAVVGVPDEQWGEAVKAVVIIKPDKSVEADELIALVKEAKGSVQAPKSVDFVDAIPLSPLGKPDKKTLRDQYWEGHERGVN